MIDNIAVIGAGTMGNGIAHVFAQAGFTVHLADINPLQLERATEQISKNFDRQISKQLLTQKEKEEALARIINFTSIAAAVQNTQLVVEAATENRELKLKIFSTIDKHAPEGCILASNTSSISITGIAAATRRPSHVIGMHFMNPVPVMKLVEIINGYATDEQVTNTVVNLAKQLGKIPCVVNDYPGFIANRILMPMINEAVFSLYEGVAGVEEIDTIMKLGMAHPMGPLQLADFIGLDVCVAILKVLHEGLGKNHYAPCPLLMNMVMAGDLGVKTGRGFYAYQAGSKEWVVSERFRK